MTNSYSISIYLDTRRAKDSGKYPVRLRVYTPMPRKQKFYSTKFELSKKEFESIWETSKPRNEHKKIRQALQAIQTRAIEVAEKMNPFSFQQFEKLLYRKAGDGILVRHHYDQIIRSLRRRKQIGTASNYTYSQKSLKTFIEDTGRGKLDNLSLYDITADWLQDYEQFLLDSGRTHTTVGIYLRPLRALFNKAIEEKEIEKDFYPFGKRKYQIPSTANTKRALNEEQLKTLFNCKPSTKEQEKAKDFWFLSFSCNGMNTKDIALLTWKDIDEDKLTFIRAKTSRTSKAHQKPIVVYLNPFIKKMIKKYGGDRKAPKEFVFDITSIEQNADEQHRSICNFSRYLNQHIKKLATSIGLPEALSPYWARHTFATSSIRGKEVTMEFMQEALGHSSKDTTQRYFAGFDDDTKRAFAQSIMDFGQDDVNDE